MSDGAEALPEFIAFGEALTDFVRTGAHSWQSAAGGSCWNVARSAAALGVASAWGGAVSRDRFGDEIMALSRAAGLDLRFAFQVDKPPLIAMVHDTSPPRYCFLGNDSADLAFDPAALPAGWQAYCRRAHFGSISLVRPPLGPRLVALAETLAAAGVRVSFDPNVRGLMGPGYPALFERLASLASLIKLSDEDLATLYPGTDVDTALAHVAEIAPATPVVYTRGAQGMRALVGSRQFEQPAFAPPGIGGDSVGAGDACVGGLIASISKRPAAELGAHLRFAAATAAAACAHTGAYTPTRADVEALLAS